MQKRWVQCRSEYYLQLRGHTERELHIASAELRKRYQNHAGESAVTAKRLADFLAEAEAHELVLKQRLHDVEARDVFAQMGGQHMLESEQVPTSHHPASASLSPESHNNSVSEERRLDEDDLEDLDEYEEFR